MSQAIHTPKMAQKKGELRDSEKLLFEKVKDSCISEIKLLLQNKDVRVDCLDEHGMTCLQHAAYKGNKQLCELLLDHGADVNSNYHDHGYTALMFAALSGNVEVTSQMLSAGASTTAINSVGRTASQMAAFVGNHNCVTVINNFMPKEAIEYYNRPQGLEVQPKLAPHLTSVLHRLILQSNLHPIRIAMFLEQNPVLLEEASQVMKVLESLCEKEMKRSDINEVLAFKLHIIASVVKACFKQKEQKVSKTTIADTGDLEEKSKNGATKTLVLNDLIKCWLKDHNLETFLRRVIREFPYTQSAILQQFVQTLAPVSIGDEPSAFTVINSCITGQRTANETEPCVTCGEYSALKKCSACKTVQYCDPKCQKLHWFIHKKQCTQLASKNIKEDHDSKIEGRH